MLLEMQHKSTSWPPTKAKYSHALSVCSQPSTVVFVYLGNPFDLWTLWTQLCIVGEHWQHL